ncbi:MAG: hypothetical protein KTR30_01140 [Saprospiraceae bacterium]|nr:hypothetical protein [Saprospiraceae bacterium]
MNISPRKIQLGIYLFLVGLLAACQPKVGKGLVESKAPRWIDKSEDENYVARHECSFVQAGNEFVMFGGRESAKRVDIYDFEKNSWRQGKEAPKEFNHFQATYYQGFIWVIGSFKTNSYPNELPEEHVWLYDLPTETWIQGPEIPEGRRRGGAGLVVYDDKFYLVGGNTIGHNGGYVNWFDEYDPQQNTWKVLPDAPRARDHFHAAVYEGQLYAVAGRQSGGPGGTFSPLVDIVDVYDFDKGTWSSLPQPLPTPRAAPGIAIFRGDLLVMGGEGEVAGPAYKIVESYNFSAKKWGRKPDMLYPRHGTQAILSGEGVYMAGGSPLRGGGNQRNMEVYYKDKPKGKELQAAELSAPNEVSIARGGEAKVTVKNASKDSGVFITDLKIEAVAEGAVEIKTAMENILLAPQAKSEILIDSSTPLESGTAVLVLTYNGKQTKRINLSLK